MDLSGAAAAWRRDGFVVLPGYLDGPELKAAQRDLAAVYPSAEEFHAGPHFAAAAARTMCLGALVARFAVHIAS
jgi:hypothetical protein